MSSFSSSTSLVLVSVQCPTLFLKKKPFLSIRSRQGEICWVKQPFYLNFIFFAQHFLRTKKKKLNKKLIAIDDDHGGDEHRVHALFSTHVARILFLFLARRLARTRGRFCFKKVFEDDDDVEPTGPVRWMQFTMWNFTGFSYGVLFLFCERVCFIFSSGWKFRACQSRAFLATSLWQIFANGCFAGFL